MSGGVNMLEVCVTSNLLFVLSVALSSFYAPRSDALFSNYFEDLLSYIGMRWAGGIIREKNAD